MTTTIDGLCPRKHVFLEAFYIVASISLVGVRFWILRRQICWESGLARKFGHLAVLFSGLFMSCHCASNLWILNARIAGEDNVAALSNSLTPAQTVIMLKLGLWFKLDYSTELYLVKAGFMAVYIEFWDNLQPRARILLSITSVYIVLAFLASILTTLLFCQPFDTNWRLNGVCSAFHSLPIVTIHYANNMLTDVLLLCIAYCTLHGLNLGRRERVATAFLISIGLVTMVAASLRYMFIYRFITAQHHYMGTTSDTTYLVTEAEMFAALIAVCLPSFRLLLRKYGSAEQKRLEEQQDRLGMKPRCHVEDEFYEYSSQVEVEGIVVSIETGQLRMTADLESGAGPGDNVHGELLSSEEEEDLCRMSRHE